MDSLLFRATDACSASKNVTEEYCVSRCSHRIRSWEESCISLRWNDVALAFMKVMMLSLSVASFLWLDRTSRTSIRAEVG